MKRRAILAALAAALVAPAALGAETRWALAPFACDGKAFSRRETPLIVDGVSIRWFDTDCRVVSSYKLAQTWYLQAQCTAQGKTAVIPIMLALQGDRLRVGWNREPIAEMQRCP